MSTWRTLAVSAAATGLAASAGGTTPLDRFEPRVTEHRLDNGWTFLMVEDHDAPVVSFFTHVNVGSAQERYGITGLAHMFEHMAFKGTTTLGTTDPVAEEQAIERLEQAYQKLQEARQRAAGPDEATVERLEGAFRTAQKEAASYVVTDAFSELVERQGGVGLNAFTSNDETGYFFSLPSNKLELWAWLESERFLHPVFREFYKERDVVMEERRMRVESSPFGRLLEEFLATAYKAHPYGHPGIGHASDLGSYTLSDAWAFYDKHYVASNMTTAIVGDVNPATTVPLLERYFGRFPERPRPEPLRTEEPPQRAERRVTVIDPAQPIYVVGWHVPEATHPDTPALQALAEVLGRGRTSRLYRDLVRDTQVAAQVQALRGYPGEKYPTLFVAYAVPTPGHGALDVEEPILEHVARLREELVTAEELRQVKSRAKANLVRELASPDGLGMSLAMYEALTGDWRNLFRDAERLEAVTAEDIRRVAKRYLTPGNRTVALSVTDPSELSP